MQRCCCSHLIRTRDGIKVALKPFQTLGHIFAKPKDRVPCDCEKEYLRQTKRQFCARLKEHQRGVFSKLYSSQSALAEQSLCGVSYIGRDSHERVQALPFWLSLGLLNDRRITITLIQPRTQAFTFARPLLIILN